MLELSSQIHDGAMTFLRREYSILVWFILLVAILLAVVIHPLTALAFVSGGVCSMLAGFFGMKAATRANVRTANAAREHGRDRALAVAFYGGSVMGLCVASLGIVGLGLWFLLRAEPMVINGFAMGASSIALFARVGGGIFTKSADIGADLVGKLEAGIPEDDPRNPAVIADNVGDNVGDVAGMGADLFESYVGSIVAAIAIGATLGPRPEIWMALPILIVMAGLVASAVGILSMSWLQRLDPPGRAPLRHDHRRAAAGRAGRGRGPDARRRVAALLGRGLAAWWPAWRSATSPSSTPPAAAWSGSRRPARRARRPTSSPGWPSAWSPPRFPSWRSARPSGRRSRPAGSTGSRWPAWACSPPSGSR